MTKTNRGRPTESCEKRDYYKKYRANLHNVIDDPVTMYKLSRLLLSTTSLTAVKNANNVGSLPTKHMFKIISHALWLINRSKVDMTEQEYSLWLLDEAE